VTHAVLGGLSRDVLCQIPPVLLHRETSGAAALFGSAVFALLFKLNVPLAINASASGIVILGIRLISIKFKWNLPRLKK
jgi:uncharacterized membrane protein YeiH